MYHFKPLYLLIIREVFYFKIYRAMEEKKYKIVDTQLLQALVNVITTSKTDLTYIQLNELIDAVIKSEDYHHQKDEATTK